MHTAAAASCKRRAGLTCTSCSFKRQSDTYRRTSHDIPCSLSFCHKTYFDQVKAMRHETDGGLNIATRYRRSCSDAKKTASPCSLSCVPYPLGKRLAFLSFIVSLSFVELSKLVSKYRFFQYDNIKTLSNDMPKLSIRYPANTSCKIRTRYMYGSSTHGKTE